LVFESYIGITFLLRKYCLPKATLKKIFLFLAVLLLNSVIFGKNSFVLNFTAVIISLRFQLFYMNDTYTVVICKDEAKGSAVER
jgi:hypothetical protein